MYDDWIVKPELRFKAEAAEAFGAPPLPTNTVALYGVDRDGQEWGMIIDPDRLMSALISGCPV